MNTAPTHPLDRDLSIEGKDLTKKHVVLSSASMATGFDSMKWRTVLAVEGFGCRPNRHHSTLIIQYVDGDISRVARANVERFASQAEQLAFQREFRDASFGGNPK